MKPWRLVMLSLWLAALACAATPEELEYAVQPLQDGVPEVAVVRLRELLAARPAADERQAMLARLVEALVASGDAASALDIADAPELASHPDTPFFRAQALAALGRWKEALPLYRAIAGIADSSRQAAAVFGTAEALRALGQRDEALEVLSSLIRDPRWKVEARLRSVQLLTEKGDTAAGRRLLDSITPVTISDRKHRRYLRGRLEAAAGNRDRAIDLFASVLKRPEGVSHPVIVATLFAVADVHLQMDRPGGGDDFLEEFIEKNPTDKALPEIFAKLDQLYTAQRKQSRHELGRWSRDAAEPRRSLALWYLARAEQRLGRMDLARQAFETLLAQHTPIAALAPAFLEAAELEMKEHRWDAALKNVDAARAIARTPEMLGRVDIMTGAVHYAAGQPVEAAETFQRSAAAPPELARVGLINASLAWLQADNPGQFAAAAREAKAHGAEADTVGDLALERALVQASRAEPEAEASLEQFVSQYPQHPRAAEAWLALAEIDFHAKPPRLDRAQQRLERALQSTPGPEATEHADYLRIWIEDAAQPRDEARLITLATEFLRKYPQSARAADVRLKLAETHYLRQDFASAQTQFEIVAKEHPTSPLTEKALFFAAQSALNAMGAESVDRALVLFDEVVKRDGDLKWAARLEQAAIERRIGKLNDAITLYDEVLRSDTNEAQKREALLGKADVLYELGSTDAEKYQQAIALYDQLAGDTGAGAVWRNQALFKKGTALEKSGRPQDALATLYEVVEGDRSGEAQREFFWFYKAGFNAARLLEEMEKWKSAAAVYEKLAMAGGGRSEEAKERLERLRLEQFLWDE